MEKGQIEIIVPETLNDITLRQYREYIKIEEPTELDLLRIFYGLTAKHINTLKLNDVTNLVRIITDILKSKPKQNQMVFTMGGVEYGFIPNLEEITYGENKDITTYLGKWDYMDRYMAVAFRPVIKKKGGLYEIEEYEGSNKYVKVMEDAPLGVVLSSMVFFWTLISSLLDATQTSLEHQTKTNQITNSLSTQKKSSVENGEVIQNYMNLLKEISEDLMISLGYHFNNV